MCLLEKRDNGPLLTGSEEEIMAVAWVAVLQMVPWGEVIKNAPKVADGAVKLWNSVSRKKSADPSLSDTTDVVLATDIGAIERLEHQLFETQNSVAELQSQVVQSAEVIKELASQNAQLVAQIEANRKAVTVLGVVVALTVLGAVVQTVVLFGS